MIYLSTSCLEGNRISDILKEYAKLGVTFIELSGGTNYYSNIYSDLKKYEHKYHVKYACHAYFPPPKQHYVVNLASCNDKIYKLSINHYRSCIQMMKSLNCDILSIHAGFYIEIAPTQIGRNLSDEIAYEHDKAIERFCSAYKKIEEECQRYGITLYLENNALAGKNFERFGKINQLMMTDYKSYQELASYMDFNLLLDIGHLHVSCDTLNLNFEEECKQFSDIAGWLHISENDGKEDQHKPLSGDGKITVAYKQYFDKSLPITLETKGDVAQILKSYEIVSKLKADK